MSNYSVSLCLCFIKRREVDHLALEATSIGSETEAILHEMQHSLRANVELLQTLQVQAGIEPSMDGPSSLARAS